MRLVDSHSHLFLEEFQSDLPQVMERAQAAGVSHISVSYTHLRAHET